MSGMDKVIAELESYWTFGGLLEELLLCLLLVLNVM